MNSRDFPVKRSGVHYKDGKLYIFNAPRPWAKGYSLGHYGKIVVIRPYPAPAAWRKIGCYDFRGYRPRIDLRTIDFDYLKLTEQEPQLQSLVHQVVDIFGIGQPDNNVQVLPYKSDSPGKPPDPPLNRVLRKAVSRHAKMTHL